MNSLRTFFTRKKFLILFFIILYGAIVIFFRLDRHDIVSDDGHYAFRAIGYFDYLASWGQQTPYQWFDFRPWWSLLSFHDHPLMFFLLEHCAYVLFGATVFVSRLIPALAGVGSLIVFYFWVKNLHSERVSLFATAALALNSYFIWISRQGLLEGLCMFFFLCGLYFFDRALQKSEKYFIPAGIFFGLSLLSKYTALVVIGAIVVYCLFFERQIFKKRWFWWGIEAFIITALPVILFNIGMFITRHHFDVQFAGLFNQSNRDWPILSNRHGGGQLHYADLVHILIEGLSIPYFLLFIGCLFSLIKSIRNKPYFSLPFFILGFLLLFFTILGATPPWLAVMCPFFAYEIGWGIEEFFSNGSFSYQAKSIVGILLSCGAMFCVFYTLNTNTFIKPHGPTWLYADSRVENFGYRQLDEYITQHLKGIQGDLSRYPRIPNPHFDESIFSEPKPQSLKPLIITDFGNGSTWFAYMWIFAKWQYYRRVPLTQSSTFLHDLDFRHGYCKQGFNEIMYIKDMHEPEASTTASTELFTALELNKNTFIPIYDNTGQLAFEVFTTSNPTLLFDLCR